MKEGMQEKIFRGKWYTYPPMRNALIAGLLTGLAFGLAHLRVIPNFAEIAIFFVAILLGGYHWSREGYEKFLKEREVGIEILMISAVVGSVVLDMWDEAAFLVFLYSTAEGLEGYTYARTRASIRDLLDLAPKEARLLRDGKEFVIRADEIKVGDIFVVKPGESIATDGIVIEGRSSVNEASVTGESIPVEKKEGMRVFAATLNQEGVLKVRAIATFEDNTLSKMIHLVEKAQDQKGRAQTFIERFGRIYSPLVLLSSFLMLIFPPMIWDPASDWSTRAVVLLVAAAPCALVMSTPVAIAAGISRAGHNGVLIKGGVCLERLGKIRVIAVDKTGTLTTGDPVVTDIVPLNGDASHVLRLAYSVERRSEHPLAKAIVRRAEETGLKCLEIADFSALPGYGAKARIDAKTVYVGKEALFIRLGHRCPSIMQIEGLRREGKTVVLVGTEDGIEGLIAIRDEIRPQAKGVIAELHGMGVDVVMLTGDNEVTARAIAEELDIDHIRSNLKPEEKVEFIRVLEEKYGVVAMVGDGINDAPALAQATVGIAMGTAGADAAIEASDVALMADDLTRVSFALKLGRRARRISLQNIVFSLSILVLLIPTALMGVMSVAFAVLFHEASELLAVANGLRVGRS